MGWQRKAKRSCFTGRLMSALGQKQTFALQQVTSALPPITTAKADSRERSCLLYPESRHVYCNEGCPLWVNSGHARSTWPLVRPPARYRKCLTGCRRRYAKNAYPPDLYRMYQGYPPIASERFSVWLSTLEVPLARASGLPGTPDTTLSNLAFSFRSPLRFPGT